MQNKEGKNTSNGKLRKRKHDAVTILNAEKSLLESKEECVTYLEDWETFNSSKLKERESVLLNFH